MNQYTMTFMDIDGQTVKTRVIDAPNQERAELIAQSIFASDSAEGVRSYGVIQGVEAMAG